MRAVSKAESEEQETVKPILQWTHVAHSCFASHLNLLKNKNQQTGPHMKPPAFLAVDCLPFPEGHLVNAYLSFHGLLTSF